MDRRDFLQKSSFAAMAAAGLPAAIRKKKKPLPSETYGSKPEAGKAKQTAIAVTISHDGIKKFKEAAEEDKTFTLYVKYYETDNHSTPTQSGSFKFAIQKSVMTTKGDADIYTVTAKFVEKSFGEYKLPKDFDKEIRLIVETYKTMEIQGNKNKVMGKLDYVWPSSSSDDEDCFLTTACVQHKELPDNCNELETLRSLRDNFMRGKSTGDQLINTYEVIGPEIVRAINACENKHHIYDYMYQNMILPSVQLVKEGKPEEAVNYYSVFVEALRNKYAGD